MYLTDEELEKYKKHPRILEVRLCTLFHIWEREYGPQNAMKLVESISRAFSCNVTMLNAVINRRFDIIRNQKVKQQLWRQEAIFMGYVYGVTAYKVAKNYLRINPNTFYSQADIYSIDRFCNNKWLSELDSRTMLCGQDIFKIEVERFLEVVETLADMLNLWKGF